MYLFVCKKKQQKLDTNKKFNLSHLFTNQKKTKKTIINVSICLSDVPNKKISWIFFGDRFVYFRLWDQSSEIYTS